MSLQPDFSLERQPTTALPGSLSQRVDRTCCLHIGFLAPWRLAKSGESHGNTQAEPILFRLRWLDTFWSLSSPRAVTNVTDCDNGDNTFSKRLWNPSECMFSHILTVRFVCFQNAQGHQSELQCFRKRKSSILLPRERKHQNHPESCPWSWNVLEISGYIS